MKKQFLVLGAGRFGSSVARNLVKLHQEVMVVDNNQEHVNELSDKVTWALQGDVTQEQNLKEIIGARNFDVVIVSIGSDIQASILTTLMLKEMGVQTVISKASNDLHAKVLYRIGADKVIFPERELGMRIAQSLVNENIIDYINLSSEFSLMEVAVPRVWVGKTIRAIDVKKHYGLNIIAIKTPNNILVEVDADRPFKQEDILVVVGSNKAIERISTL